MARRKNLVGETIKSRREELGLTQPQLAALAGIYRNDVIALEKNRRGLGLDVGRRVALALDVPLERLGFTPDEIDAYGTEQLQRIEALTREALERLERIEQRMDALEAA